MKLDKDIAIWDNIIEDDVSMGIIQRYHNLEKLQLSFPRFESPSHAKEDRSVYVLSDDALTVTPDTSVLHPFLRKFWLAWTEYCKHYSVLGETGKHFIRSMKIQKTLPGQGYHLWHFESDSIERSARIAAWSLYLNTIEEGGETEFLYQHARVTAVKNRLVLWPATFTHVHRGNPPLSGEKYILTGWVEW